MDEMVKNTIIVMAAIFAMAVIWILIEKTIKKIRNKKEIFFISPVRLATLENLGKLKKYVEKLEKEGYRVHWPIRDTDQNDPLGNKICDTNLRKIFEAGEIHIWFSKDSTGSLFDLGGAYMLIRILKYKKKIVFANKDEFADEPEGKSFIKVLRFLEKTTK